MYSVLIGYCKNYQGVGLLHYQLHRSPPMYAWEGLNGVCIDIIVVNKMFKGLKSKELHASCEGCKA